jgi:hypothetical protein
LLVRACVLGCRLLTISSLFSHQAADDGHKSHENGKEHNREKTSDDTEDDLRNLIDEPEPRE